MHDLYFFLTDLAAGLALAAAASCRARANGAHFSGAAVLACVSGVAAPLARDSLLGCAALTLTRGEYLAAAVAGALLGALFARSRMNWKAVFWLDAAGLALSAGVGAVKAAVFGLGMTGSLLLGVVAALTGGFVRDVALGDMARFVEEDMYATAAALGSLLALAVLLYARLPAWQCALAGAASALLLRRLRAKPAL